MKVLWFSNTPANSEAFLNNRLTGGGWLKSLDLAIQAKVELHIAFYFPKLSEPFTFLNTTYYPISHPNWKLKAVINTLRPSFTDTEDLQQYLEIINKVQPDIIHIHGTENPFGCIIPQVNAPVVVSIQGNITVYQHKFFAGLGKGYAKKKYAGSKLINNLLQKSFYENYKGMEKMKERELKNLKATQYVLGRTDWDKRLSMMMTTNARYFQSEEMMREVFHHTKWMRNSPGIEEPFIIHSTTGNGFYKGFETICEAVQLLHNKIEFLFEWRVAGLSDTSSLVKVVKEKMGKAYPKSGLILMGSLSEEALAVKLTEAHVFVTASHIENSPNSLCEAMLIGMPCIATFAGGTGSMIQDRQEGILIQDGDPWVMAGAIVEMAYSFEVAIGMGAKARLRALKRHDKDGIVTQLLDIYQTVIKHHTDAAIV